MSRADEILQTMARNRRHHDATVAALRYRTELPATERHELLGRAWLDAMGVHLQLLDEYLALRETSCRRLNQAGLAPAVPALGAPTRPRELPESLSRYVTFGPAPTLPAPAP